MLAPVVRWARRRLERSLAAQPSPAERVGEVGGRARVATLAVVLLVLVAVFAGRLVDVQVIHGPAIAQAARDDRMSTITVAGTRGSITDSTGVVLASSVPRYDISVNQKLISANRGNTDEGVAPGARGVAQLLAPLLGTDSDELVAKLVGKAGYRYLAKGVEPKVAREIAQMRLSGINVELVSVRVYPNGALAGDIIGFTGSGSQGRQGLESSLDDQLRGTAGTQVYERGRTGQPIPGGYHSGQAAVDGRSLTLTIRADLQWKAEDAIAEAVAATGASSGQIVIMDPNTGEILALADDSTVDPNNPGPGAGGALSSAVSDVFEPGSTGKVVTMAAALETGAVTPTTQFTVPDTYSVGRQTFHDSHPHAVQHLTTAGVLAESSNTGTVQVGQRMSAQTEYEYLRKFGFGSRTGIEMPGESAGILHHVDDWDGRTRYNVLFGQGLAVTAVQAASVYATVANGGVRIAPHLIKGWTEPDGTWTPVAPPAPARVVSALTAAQLGTMLESVVDDGTGSSAAVPGYRVAGKTGTAQNLGTGGFTASFVGFAPADNPKIVVAVILHDPHTSIYGGVVAAPVFSDVTAYSLTALHAAPSGVEPTLYATTW
ncbi:MAG: penicillin-binding protein 2 [Micrococcales bacterium]|nr:penicillin-binding protein 2 [Micrococcales bacterium]